MAVECPWDQVEERPSAPTLEQFLAGRAGRVAQSNPERIDDPFMEHSARWPHSTWWTRPYYEVGESGQPLDPSNGNTAIWSFWRRGYTCTLYQNRFRIYIGGQYRDSNEPDFQIYNDVVAFDTMGNPYIYGYPRDAFPPTTHHSSTLLDDDANVPRTLREGILVVGGNGYLDDLEYWDTSVYYLDLNEMAFQRIETSGAVPGAIYRHTAALLPGGKLLIVGGEVFDAENKSQPNHDRYELDLFSLAWNKTS